MKFCALILCSVACSLLVVGKASEVSDLREHLLKGYNNGARPVKRETTKTTVKIALSINSLNLDDRAQRMSVVTYLRVGWKDEFLEWNHFDFGNIKSVHFDKEEIWTPDVALFNSARSSNTVPKSTLPLLCKADGSVLWVPPFSAEVPCQVDIADWPSDVHTCYLRFGSWAHHGEQINIELADASSIYMELYEVNKRWSVVNYTAVKESAEYDGEIYLYVDFKITVKRDAASHAAYVTQTTFAVMLIILGSYLLPICYHLSRFLLHLFSLCILVSCNYVLFLTLPATGGSIPHVVKYYSGTIVLTVLSLLCNVIMATTMTSSFRLQHFISKKFDRIVNTDSSRMDLDNSEIAYSTLEDDVSVPPNSTRESNQEPKNTKEKERADTRRITRLLNGVLFFMFGLAYIIDYSVMRNAIGY